jgi:hypothetical protein
LFPLAGIPLFKMQLISWEKTDYFFWEQVFTLGKAQEAVVFTELGPHKALILGFTLHKYP